MIKDQIQIAYKLIEDQLIPRGWRRRIRGLFTLDMGSETLGWIGLNRATHKTGGVLLINPVVGIRNQKLEQQVAQLSGAEFHPYIPPSMCANLGYLMPDGDFVQWAFSPEQDARAVVSVLVQAIQDYGMPFIRANADLKHLLDTMLHARFGFPEQLIYRVPVAYLMLGQTGIAKRELDKHLVALADADHPAALAYREFASALQKAINGVNS